MTTHPLTRRGARLLAVPAVVAALGLTVAACGSESAPADPENAAATIAITDAQNRTVQVPTEPEVVVSLDWSVTRTLTDLGVEVDATPTPNGSLPADLSRYEGDAVAKVGSLFEPDYEAINALEPDLVIVGSRSGTPEVVAELEKITPAVIDMSTRFERPEDQVPMTTERVIQLGSIFGVEEEARTRMAAVTAGVEEAGAKAEAAGWSAMFVQVSGGSASAYGPGSRFGLVYSDFGFADTGAPVDEEGSHGQEVAQEFFSEYDPGVIYVLDRAKAIGETETPALDVLNNDLVNTTTAAQEQRIFEVDGFSWYLATAAPSSLEQMTADVNQAFSTQ